MILVGNQRGGARQLADHLLKEENDHVDVHEVSGFACEDLHGGLQEAYAVSRGTRCKQFLFAVSLNPPANEKVGMADFKDAVQRIEDKLGLTGQPRAIVFHEKEGRRHAHAVWSRIDTKNMKAVQMSHSHRKLQDVSRELYRQHGWEMPKGLVSKSERDPRNFTLAQWQQSKRTRKDPREIKTAFQDAWAISDSKAAFTHALEERGYKLARGDRRGFVAVDHLGEIYAVSKWADVKTKDVRARLGDEATLPSTTEAKVRFAAEMLHTAERINKELEAEQEAQSKQLEKQRRELVARQKQARAKLKDRQHKRLQSENNQRQARFRSGLSGIWDRIRGEHKRILERNLAEAETARLRDQAERDRLVQEHLVERRRLKDSQHRQNEIDAQHQERLDDMRDHYEAMRDNRPQGRVRNRGPSFER